MRLHDTALGHPADLVPRQPGKVSMYVCGPTVYDPPHLGHGRFRSCSTCCAATSSGPGFEVTYVSNITDIDDKIIKRANREEPVAGGRGRRVREGLVRRHGRHRREAARPTTPTPPPTSSEMVAFIGGLVDGRRGLRDVRRRVPSGRRPSPTTACWPASRSTSLRAGARVEVNEEKRSPVDFALWKKAKPGEPSWPSPWGAGRPGWHTECVVMSLDLLGDGFDLHGGGQDLAFPHHENERAQAVAAGRAFARQWVHNGFVEVGGEKMSKSLGNFTTLIDLLAAHDPRAYRLLVLQSHYRAPVEVTPGSLEHASATLRGLDDFVRRTADQPAGTRPIPRQWTPSGRRWTTTCRPRPWWRCSPTSAAGPTSTSTPARPPPPRPWWRPSGRSRGPSVCGSARRATRSFRAEVVDLVERRDQARAGRDFATADAIRHQLEAMGWVVEDTPSGTQVHR